MNTKCHVAVLQVDDKEAFEKVLHEVKHNVAPLDAPVPPDPSQAVMASESLSDLHTRILRKASQIAFPTEPMYFVVSGQYHRPRL